MKWVIDRIESDIAVIEVGDECIDIPTRCLPIEVKEGDVLSLNIDKDATSEQLKKARDMMNNLFSD